MKRNALLIGSFVLLALAIAVGAVFWLSGGSLFKKQERAMVYYTGNVSGLYVGAPVTFRGVSAGQVEDIAVEVDGKTLAARIAVRIKLDTESLRFTDQDPDTAFDLKRLVDRGLRARVVAQSFVTGQKSIELDFVPDTPATLLGSNGQAEIPGLADKFGALIDQVADLPLRDTVQDLRDTVKEMRNALITTRQSLEGAQAVLSSAAQEVLKTGAASRETLKSATDAIRQVQGGTTATLASITQLSDAARSTVAGAQPELQRTLAGSREAVESARLAMNRIAEMTAPGAALRSDLDASVRDLSQAARSLRDWSELLEEKPNAIIFGTRRE